MGKTRFFNRTRAVRRATTATRKKRTEPAPKNPETTTRNAIETGNTTRSATRTETANIRIGTRRNGTGIGAATRNTGIENATETGTATTAEDGPDLRAETAEADHPLEKTIADREAANAPTNRAATEEPATKWLNWKN